MLTSGIMHIIMVKMFFQRWFRKENWRNGFAPFTGGLALLALIYIGAVVVYNTNIIPSWSVASEHAKSVETHPTNDKSSPKTYAPTRSGAVQPSATTHPIDSHCYKTDFVPYKTIVVSKDYMAKGETQMFGEGEDGFTEKCINKAGQAVTLYVSPPMNVTEFIGTGVDDAKQQAADAQQLEIEKQQRELSAENAGRYAQSTTYQNCVNKVAGTSLVQSWCPQVAQDAYNQAYNNYLNSHPLP